MKYVINGLGTILIALLLAFIGLNVMSGCQSWHDGSCISPRDLLKR